jgi:hypothetical protein
MEETDVIPRQLGTPFGTDGVGELDEVESGDGRLDCLGLGAGRSWRGGGDDEFVAEVEGLFLGQGVEAWGKEQAG